MKSNTNNALIEVVEFVLAFALVMLAGAFGIKEMFYIVWGKSASYIEALGVEFVWVAITGSVALAYMFTRLVIIPFMPALVVSSIVSVYFSLSANTTLVVLLSSLAVNAVLLLAKRNHFIFHRGVVVE